MLNLIKLILLVLLTGGSIVASFGAGYMQALAGAGGTSALAQVQQRITLPGTQPSTSLPKEFSKVNEIWTILSQDFVDSTTLDAEKLSKGAIDGIIAALGDAHTTYIDAVDYKAEQFGIRGTYEGIGASVMIVDNVLTVVAPIPGSPAEAAGIQAGDKILAIDGQQTQGVDLNSAVNMVKGPQGSKVSLLVQHPDGSQPVVVAVTRAEIKTSSVIYRMGPDTTNGAALPSNVAHIRIVQFAQRTGSELKDAIHKAVTANAKGIILDLRNNPGGLLDTTVESSSQFFDGGIAGYQVDRDGRKTELPLQKGAQEALTIPLVVLVNRGSASGSELLAGALQDRGRAPLIGTRTFGKGSVNHLRELTDGSALYVTIGRWLTPNGRQIEGNGLQPDYSVDITNEDVANRRDPQWEKALEVLQGQMGGAKVASTLAGVSQ